MYIDQYNKVKGIRHAYVLGKVNNAKNKNLHDTLLRLEYVSTLNEMPMDDFVFGRAVILEVFRRMMACI